MKLSFFRGRKLIPLVLGRRSLLGSLVVGWALTGLVGSAAAQEEKAEATSAAAETPGVTGEQWEKATTDFLTPMLGEKKTAGPHFENVKEALKHFRTGKMKESREALEAAYKATPKLAPPEYMLARMCFMTNQPMLGRFGRAELEQAVRKHSDDPEAYILIAEIALAEGRLAESRLMFRQGQIITGKYTANPERVKNCALRALAGLATIEEASENWSKARDYLNEWVKTDPKSGAAQHRLSNTLFKLKSYDEAYAALKKAVQLEEKLPPADVTMGGYYWNAGDKKKAKEHFDKALAAGTKDFKTRMALGSILLSANLIDEARKNADSAVQLKPDSVEALSLQGVCARMKQDYTVAKSCFEKVYLNSPSNVGAVNQLALTLIESKSQADRARALDFAKTNWDRNKQNVEAAATLGWVLYQLGRKEEAGAAFQVVAQALRERGLSPDIAYYFATFLDERGQKADAIRLLDQALDNDRPFMYRAQAAALLGKLKGAGSTSKKDAGTTSRATADKK